jgi:hypothetical protein
MDWQLLDESIPTLHFLVQFDAIVGVGRDEQADAVIGEEIPLKGTTRSTVSQEIREVCRRIFSTG